MHPDPWPLQRKRPLDWMRRPAVAMYAIYMLAHVVLAATLTFVAISYNHRLSLLETCTWGSTRAPEVVDPHEEINANYYRTAAAMVALQPAVAPLVREAFSDGIIDRGEFEAIDDTFAQLDCTEQPGELDDAKAALGRRLEPQHTKDGGIY